MANSLPWHIVCSTLERLPKQKRAEKKSSLEKLFEHHRNMDPEVKAKRATVPSGQHMYSLVRLMLPQMDRDEKGGNVLYHMKEQGIAKAFIRALGLEGTASSTKLINWKKPEGGEGFGHFAIVLYHQLILPGRSHGKGLLVTVAEVNTFLNCMAETASDKEAQNQVVIKMLKLASAYELKWIAKVMLRELRASATEDLVLSSYHPDANELYKVSTRLREVVEKCCDRNKRIGEACIQVNNPFKPMLAEKTQELAKIPKNFKNRPFWIETKLDGERLVLHMLDGVMQSFSRSCNSNTSLYAPLLEKLKPFIKAKTCILDGEVLAWNTETERWMTFGNNVTVALSMGGTLSGGRVSDQGSAKSAGDKMKDDPALKHATLCLVLFDVLLIGDEKLEQQPLYVRRDRLLQLIDIDGLKKAKLDKMLQIVSHTVATTVEQVNNELEQGMLTDAEGLMLKDPASIYKANMRDKSGWYKLKPEYIHGGIQEYDVVIIGASYGKNLRSGNMWTFACGIAVKPPDGQKYPTEFLSFCRIGTGLKHKEFRELDMHMRPQLRKFDVKKFRINEPASVEGDMTIQKVEKGVSVKFSKQSIGGESLPAVTVWFSGSSQEEVEVLFDPRKSVVLTLTADYRLVDGGVWMAGREDGRKEKRGWTLRFPRVKPQGIRLTSLGGSDKSWHDVMDTVEFNKQIQRCKEGKEGTANAKKFSDALEKGETLMMARKAGKEGAVKRGTAVAQGIAASSKYFDAESTPVISDVLNGCILCILPAAPGVEGERRRLEIQTMAHQLGSHSQKSDRYSLLLENDCIADLCRNVGAGTHIDTHTY